MGYQFLFIPNERSCELIKTFAKFNPNVKIISSFISSNTFSNCLKEKVVISPIITKETERSPPNEKKCYRNKWNFG